MYKLQGEFGEILFDSSNQSRYITIPTGTAIKLFNKVALVAPDLVANELGLFTVGSIGRNKEVVFTSINAPKHILGKRRDGCTWSPKGKITNDIEKTTLCPVEYQGENCPDAFWDSCFETVFGTGNDVKDMFATAEGRALQQEIIRKIYLGLGNSFYELAMWGNHPLIDEADSNGWYTAPEDEWADYTDQQEACTGIMTLVDELKATGLPNYNVPIHLSDVDGDRYVGDAFALLDRVINTSSSLMSQALRQGVLNGRAPILQVTKGIFDRLTEQLMIKFSQIPDMYFYFMMGTNQDRTMLPGILRYKGYIIYCNDAWAMFDELTGTITHRVMLSTPGIFGIVADVPDLKQFSGMGLRITQHLDAPYNGKIFMDTTFKMATAILSKSLVNNASLTLTPQ